jgi:DNA uptake protein ComE-like DNA-binding protein
MQIGDLPLARNPVENGVDLPLWGRFLVLVSIAVLAGWLVLPPPGDEEGLAEAQVASAAPPSGIVSAAPPQPAAPVRAALAEPPKAEPPKTYPNPIRQETMAVMPEAEPVDGPVYTGSTPAAAPSPPVGEPAPKAVKAADPVPVSVPMRTQVASAGSAPVAPAVRPGGAVDLNAASVQELNSLRGAGLIGKAIVRGRPYRSVEDLVKRRIVNRSLYARIKDQVTVR